MDWAWEKMGTTTDIKCKNRAEYIRDAFVMLLLIWFFSIERTDKYNTDDLLNGATTSCLYFFSSFFAFVSSESQQNMARLVFCCRCCGCCCLVALTSASHDWIWTSTAFTYVQVYWIFHAIHFTHSSVLRICDSVWIQWSHLKCHNVSFSFAFLVADMIYHTLCEPNTLWIDGTCVDKILKINSVRRSWSQKSLFFFCDCERFTHDTSMRTKW